MRLNALDPGFHGVRVPLNLWLARWVVGVGREVRRLAGAGAPVPLPQAARTSAMLCADSDRCITTITTERARRVPHGVFLRSHWNQPSPMPLQASVSHSL